MMMDFFRESRLEVMVVLEGVGLIIHFHLGISRHYPCRVRTRSIPLHRALFRRVIHTITRILCGSSYLCLACLRIKKRGKLSSIFLFSTIMRRHSMMKKRKGGGRCVRIAKPKQNAHIYARHRYLHMGLNRPRICWCAVFTSRA